MQYAEPSSLFSAHWRFIFLIAFSAAGLAALFSLFQPLEYRANVQLLVTPIVSNTGVLYDQYTALKSSEQVAQTLSNVAQTMLFLDKVSASPLSSGLDPFPDDGRLRRLAWSKKIETLVVNGTGLLTISIYDINPQHAVQLAHAVSEVMVAEGPTFIPGKIEIRVVDPPILSQYPVRPNIPLRALFGFIFGGLLGGLYLYLRPSALTRNEFHLMS